MASNPFDQFDKEVELPAVEAKANPFDAFDERELTAARVGELINRGMLPATTGATAGAVIGAPVGLAAPLSLVGSMAIPLGDALNTLYNAAADLISKDPKYKLAMPSDIVSGWMEQAGFGQRPQDTTERVIEAGAGGLSSTGTQLTGLGKLAKEGASTVTREVAKQLSAAPAAQLAISAPTASIAQYVTEETGSPVLGQIAALTAGATSGVRPRKSGFAPSAEQLAQESSLLFKQAKESNVTFKPEKFTQKMQDIGAELRAEGYSPKGYPKITAALEEMQNTTTPKDFTELQTLRKMIQNAQGSLEPAEKRLASILKEKFDDYVSTAPKDDISAGTKEGIEAWKQARNSYSRLMKSEVFSDMLENAQLDRSKFTQSGAENSMAQQLRSLAKNDKKMRMFTAEEQEAIKQAAKGDTTQNLLKFYGRFAPTGPVGGLFTGGATVAEPTIGVPLALGAMASRAAATKLRQQSIEDLVAQMRLGQPVDVTPRTALSPLMGARGLLSTQDATRQFIEQENPLGF